MSHSAKHEKIQQESDVSYYGIKEERVKCDAWSESHVARATRAKKYF